jgi:hypothetical protein
MLSTEDSLSASMARRAAHGIRRVEIRDGMELWDAAEKARSRTSVSNREPHFRRWRLICPNASRPFFREIPLQKAGGAPRPNFQPPSEAVRLSSGFSVVVHTKVERVFTPRLSVYTKVEPKISDAEDRNMDFFAHIPQFAFAFFIK